ncbi:hypothetical protein AB0E10_13990 [Streptomyces sp. NPDC048045]|uniref:hypothetical protein n=1 Tax=Streptomyces sp. NPDC048045 TaxID=3154710 RepID=UPI00341E995C
MGEERENQMASHAARMLTAVGYHVELDPGLAVTRITTPTNPAGDGVLGHSVLALVGHLNGTATYGAAADIVDEVVDPHDGVLVRLGDFFEAAAAQANAAGTQSGWDLSYVFEDAAATVRELGTDLHAASDRMRDLGPLPNRGWQEGIARYYATAPNRHSAPAAAVSDESVAAPHPTPVCPAHRRNR